MDILPETLFHFELMNADRLADGMRSRMTNHYGFQAVHCLFIWLTAGCQEFGRNTQCLRLRQSFLLVAGVLVDRAAFPRELLAGSAGFSLPPGVPGGRSVALASCLPSLTKVEGFSYLVNLATALPRCFTFSGAVDWVFRRCLHSTVLSLAPLSPFSSRSSMGSLSLRCSSTKSVMDCDRLPNFLDHVVLWGIVAPFANKKGHRRKQPGSRRRLRCRALYGQDRPGRRERWRLKHRLSSRGLERFGPCELDGTRQFQPSA